MIPDDLNREQSGVVVWADIIIGDLERQTSTLVWCLCHWSSFLLSLPSSPVSLPGTPRSYYPRMAISNLEKYSRSRRGRDPGMRITSVGEGWIPWIVSGELNGRIQKMEVILWSSHYWGRSIKDRNFNVPISQNSSPVGCNIGSWVALLWMVSKRILSMQSEVITPSLDRSFSKFVTPVPKHGVAMLWSMKGQRGPRNSIFTVLLLASKMEHIPLGEPGPGILGSDRNGVATKERTVRWATRQGPGWTYAL